MAVERCICHNIHFKDILEIAEKNGFSSVEELQEQEICCTNCKLCVPYIEKTLQTGITRFRPDDYLTPKTNN